MKKFLACLLVLLMSVTAVASAAALPIPKGNAGKQSTRNQSRTTEAPTAEPETTAEPTAEPVVTALPTAEPTAVPTAVPTAAPAADDTAFSFRNGVHWGMTPDEVAAAEGREADFSEDLSAAYSQICFSDVAVSRYTAEIGYIYCGSALQAAVYGGFESDHQSSDFTYLSGALSSVYGQPESADAEELFAMTDHFGPRPEIDPASLIRWSLEDGTAVYMFTFAQDFCILYINTGFFESSAAYDVTGL